MHRSYEVSVMSISPACHDKTGPALVPVPGGESVTCSDGLPEGADPGSPGDAPKSCIGHTTLTHRFLSAPDQAYCTVLLGNARRSVVRSRLNRVFNSFDQGFPARAPRVHKAAIRSQRLHSDLSVGDVWQVVSTPRPDQRCALTPEQMHTH